MAELHGDAQPRAAATDPPQLLEDRFELPRLWLSRRTFLIGALGAVGVAYVKPNRLMNIAFPPQHAILADDTNPTNPVNPIVPIGGNGANPDIVISAERDSDLVLLDFEFFGFRVLPGTPPTIAPTTTENVVIVQFPPQAVGESVYPWSGNTLPVDPPPILSDLSGPSRLCFRLPLTGSIPLPTMTVSDLLDWSGWGLLVPPVAQVGSSLVLGESGAPTVALPAQPTEFETAIEFPYALFLAPTVDESTSVLDLDRFTTEFVSRSDPLVSPAGVVDLWSTSLSGSEERRSIIIGPTEPTAPYVPQVAAVWAADYQPSAALAGAPNDTPENVIEYDLVIIK
jgi:hypothetical protein